MGLNITEIAVAFLGILSSATMAKLLQLYFKEKKAKREGYHSDGIAFRQNLVKRINKLEKTINKNHNDILDLSTENATLKAELDNYKDENKELKKQVKGLLDRIKDLRG